MFLDHFPGVFYLLKDLLSLLFDEVIYLKAFIFNLDSKMGGQETLVCFILWRVLVEERFLPLSLQEGYTFSRTSLGCRALC